MRATLRTLLSSALALAASCTLLAAPAHAWSHDNTVHVPIDAANYTPYQVSVADGSGGQFVVFPDTRTAGHTDLYAQHLNAAGQPLWVTNGVPIAVTVNGKNSAQVILDGAGGIIVAWIDMRTAGSNGDVYAQRLNASGAPVWALNGVNLCANAGAASGVQLATDFAGGAILAWVDGRAGQRIYAQRVSAGGIPQWTVDGLPVGAAAAGNQFSPSLATVQFPTGFQAFIAWVDSRNAPTADDIFLQTLSANGALLLAAAGQVVCNAAGSQSDVRIVADVQKFLFLTWRDNRSGTSQIYAEKFQSNYINWWASNGVPVSVTTGSQSSGMPVPDGNGGLYVVYNDQITPAIDSDLYVQHLSAVGQSLWNNGVLAQGGGGGQFAYSALVTGGNFVIAWEDLSVQWADVRAQAFAANGAAQWTYGGVVVGGGPDEDAGPLMQPDGNGGVVVTFLDGNLNTAVFSLVAHGVDRFGRSGAEPAIASIRDVALDNGGQVRVSWNASALDTDPADGSISDYFVYRAMSPAAAATAMAAGPLARHAVLAASLAGSRPDPAALLVTGTGANAYYWEQVATEPARHLANYSHTCSTTNDSVAAGNPRTAFMIYAATYGTSYWTSAPDSGYSVDNLPPVQPAPFTGQYGVGSTKLHWDPNHEADLAGYELYRGTSTNFALDASHLLTALPDTGYADAAGAPYIYKLVALDAHGNRSPAATLLPSGTLAVGDAMPHALAFAAPAPNPLRSGGVATLRFALPVAGHVRLALMSVDGREAAVLADGMYAAGEHAIAFSGRDGAGGVLAPGLYFARLVTPAGERGRRIVIVR